MTDSTRDPWQTDRPWQIVRADLDLAHVFIPLSSFRFQPVSAAGGAGYTIVHSYQAPNPDCFAGTVLRPAGTRQPTFERIAERKTLPAYDQSSASVYADISAKIATFVDQDREVQRLEGVIKVPCHAHGAKLESDVVPHSPFWIKTLIHVYQFSNAVDGGFPLLLFRAPLSPLCPANTDGTAVGIAK